MNELDKANRTPPGEGERRAVRGLVSQYDFAARVIYASLASRKLCWVGLADRRAGSFDDVVLGLHDKIVGHQIKSRRDPDSFNIRTLLLEAEKLLLKLSESWTKLRTDHPGVQVEVVFSTDNFPSTRDNIGDREDRVSSAAYLRTHEAHHHHWTIQDWRASAFGPFINDLATASGLADQEFSIFWQNVTFQTGGTSDHIENLNTEYSQKRLADLSALLPRLVADRANQDRWSVEELLKKLNWRDVFNLWHEHVFPTDSLVQSNDITESALKAAFDSVSSGYLSLLGPPGSGKSTLLQSGLLPIPRAAVLRYLAFTPDEGHGLGRAEAVNFLHDLVSQLNGQGLGPHVIPGTELPELRSQLWSLLARASERYRTEAIKTIFVIDGLDHVPREERPVRSFLQELPLPNSVPDGIIFLLGTQRAEPGWHAPIGPRSGKRKWSPHRYCASF